MSAKIVFLSHHQMENMVAFEGLLPHLQLHGEAVFIKLCPTSVEEGWHPTQPLHPDSRAFYDLKTQLQLWQPLAVVYDSQLQWIATSPLPNDLADIRWVCADLSFSPTTTTTITNESLLGNKQFVTLHYSNHNISSASSAVAVSYPIDRNVQPKPDTPLAVVLALSTPTLYEEYRAKHPFVDQLLTTFASASTAYSSVQFICVSPTTPPLTSASSSVLFVTGINLSEWNVKLLITDGDNLVLQAALVLRIPILVLPFTSRHQTLGEWVTQHQAGLVIPPTHTLTLADDPCHNPHRALDSMPWWISELLSWRHAPLPLIPRAFFSPVATILNRLPLQPGDVILGCRLDRSTYFRERNLTLESVGFYENTETQVLDRADPVFIDHYLDLLRYPYKRRQRPLVTDPLDIRFRPAISKYLERHRELELTDQHIVDACVVVMDALLAQGVCLHFVLDAFVADKCPVTRAEMMHIFRFHNQRIDRQIFFYTLHPHLQRLFIYDSEYARSTLSLYVSERFELFQRHQRPELEEHLQPLCSPTIKMQFRVKSVDRLLQNLWRDNEHPQLQYFADLFGFRIVTLHTHEREHICRHLESRLGNSHHRQADCVNVFRLFSDVEVQVCTQTQMLQHDAPFHKNSGFFSTTQQDLIKAFHSRLEQVQQQVDAGLF